ncbi:HNH endonuclease signature motif containing protein [Corynebacterium meitnerae]|uniref:HNH endonuclease n=1 Tax=Corynebacterium meitnerae TaxID=2913498 RepID=A0A9X3RKM7_9CORY|nr:HNH endonuclease signature motif containing protein [Corynebacterium meitnerae]MCZ9293043.1 HNH endonuclease [Corynebacterium meitnerae]
MIGFGEFLGAVAAGIDTLAGFDRQAAFDAGVQPKRVRDWSKVHEVYFGSTRLKRQQKAGVDKARVNRVSMDTLILIEERTKLISDPLERWRLRHRLLDVRGNYETVRRRAKEIVPTVEPPPPEDGVTFTGSRSTKRTMTMTGPERFMADLEHAMSQDIDPSRPRGPQLFDAFVKLMESGGGVAQAAPRPLVLVPLPEHIRIVRQEGDETILGLTDGTTMTGAELLATCYGADLEVGLFHPQEGAVNLYRGQRFANQKQRDLARAVTPACPVPGCRHGADACELHHITAWKHGGETNLNNLVPLCRYHNRVNDDDPWRQARGRVERIRGAPVWVSPRGYPVINERHPFGALSSLFGNPIFR